MTMKDFIGLKSKIYTFITEGNHESKKEKGISVDDELKYEDCKNDLFNRSYMGHEMNKIQSTINYIGSYRIKIISLSSDDDKKIYIFKNEYNRLSNVQKFTR